MRTWAVANQKGGVGKTTTAISMAGLLAIAHRPTLLLDLDPHGSLSSYLGFDPDRTEKSIYNLFQMDRINSASELDDLIQPTRFENLFIMPASSAQATLDKQLGAQDGKGLVIQRALSLLSEYFEYAIIDCPPMLGILMVNALAACEHLLIPVQTEFLALKGLERMLHTLKMIQQARNQTLSYTVIPTMFDRRTRASIDTLRTLREQYEGTIWKSTIPIDTRFREASKEGIPLPLMHRYARGVLAYNRLLVDLLGDESPIKVVAV